MNAITRILLLCVMVAISGSILGVAYAQVDSTKVNAADLPIELPGVVSSILFAFAPVVIQFINNKVSNTNAKFGIAIGLSAITGIIAYYVDPLDAPLYTQISFAFTYGQIAYKLVWKQIGPFAAYFA